MVLGDLDKCMQKMKLDQNLTPYSRINSRWIKDLNISHHTLNILEEIISNKTSDIPPRNIFANVSPRARK